MSFLRVEVLTNPIPAHVLVPRPFQNPSGGSGGAGSGTFNLFAGGGLAGFYAEPGDQVVAPGGPSDILVLPVEYRAGRSLWGMFTCDGLFVNNFPGPPVTQVEGSVSFTLDFGNGQTKGGTLAIIHSISQAQPPFALQAIRPAAVAGLFTAKIRVTNSALWATYGASSVTVRNPQLVIAEIPEI